MFPMNMLVQHTLFFTDVEAENGAVTSERVTYLKWHMLSCEKNTLKWSLCLKAEACSSIVLLSIRQLEEMLEMEWTGEKEMQLSK